MAQKITARFFTVRQSKGEIVCSIHGKQAGTVFKDGSKFWAGCADKFCTSDMFDTFAAAERWLWLNYA